MKLWLFSYPYVNLYVLGTKKNRLIETVLLSTHNICFGWEIRKLICNYSYLSEGLLYKSLLLIAIDLIGQYK